MGNDDRGQIGVGEDIQHGIAAFIIERGSRLISEYDSLVEKERANDGDALLFSA